MALGRAGEKLILKPLCRDNIANKLASSNTFAGLFEGNLRESVPSAAYV